MLQTIDPRKLWGTLLLKAVIVEKEEIPRHKACSGILVPDSINTLSEHFGNVPQDVLAVPSHVNAMRMHFPGGYVGDIPMHVLMIWRDLLDAWLCRTSQAEVLDETKMQSFKCLQLQNGLQALDWKERVIFSQNLLKWLLTLKT